MDSQGVAASSAPQAGGPQRANASTAVTAELKDSSVSQVAIDVADGGDGGGLSGDDTLVMTAPGHQPATTQPEHPGGPEHPVGPERPERPASRQAAEDGPAPEADRDESEQPATDQAAPDQVAPDQAAAGEVAPAEVAAGEVAPAEVAAAEPVPDQPAPAEAVPAGAAPDQAEPLEAASPEPHVRVDARLLEAALLNLRKRIAAIPLVFELEGAAEVKAERAKLLNQIDDYLLPRVRRSAAPVLVALVGSTGAGKSTLVNSIVGAKVSATGVRRPTTNSPVLACHPDDIDWFAENNFLPTLPRVRQEGLARPGRDGLLVLAASEGMPRGIALLDTPDIDSVVQAHHEFAYQFLDASDLWLFMTSSSRYADSPVWEILQHARDRRASLGVVLSRVPQAYRTELVSHFEAMLDANGITAKERFVILETPLLDGMLPPDAYHPVRQWLTDTATHEDRRVAVLTQTMSGVLDTFKTRVPKVAAHVEAQVQLRIRLRREAAQEYQKALTEAEAGLRNASLLQGEVLARWQDCIASGDLRGRAPRSVQRAAQKAAQKKGKRARRGPQRVAALRAALRAALESFIISLADRAAEQTHDRWRDSPAGALLLADAAAERARDEQVKQVFESAFGNSETAPLPGKPFSRSGPDLPLRAGRAVAAWQDQLTRQAGDRNPEVLGLVTAIAMLAEGCPEPIAAQARELAGFAADGQGTGGQGTGGQGAGGQGVDERAARADLVDRIRLLFDEELLTFSGVIDAAGPCDDVAAIRLYQAEYSLEAVR
jgi:energy-coupling factor transporter ATP-binding protein EcfA2